VAGPQQTSLIVGFSSEQAERFALALRDGGLFASAAANARSALDWVALLPFDAVVTAHPLPDMSSHEFIAAVRAPGSLCRQTALVVVAPSEHRDEATRLLSEGGNRLVALEDGPSKVAETVRALLQVKPRFSVRAASRLKVQLPMGNMLLLCQTENISVSGMLVRTDQDYPLGTMLAFELRIPGENAPVRGYGVVVRHANSSRERIDGIGVRFSSFEPGDKGRLESQLSKLMM
jgi:CheY-like chemotaxis protein/Tfp pilus assembly protein PilZ